jgi:hypothetical protein
MIGFHERSKRSFRFINWFHKLKNNTRCKHEEARPKSSDRAGTRESVAEWGEHKEGLHRAHSSWFGFLGSRSVFLCFVPVFYSEEDDQGVFQRKKNNQNQEKKSFTHE